MLQALSKHVTQWDTVPQVFIKGKFIGGGDDTESMFVCFLRTLKIAWYLIWYLSYSQASSRAVSCKSCWRKTIIILFFFSAAWPTRAIVGNFRTLLQESGNKKHGNNNSELSFLLCTKQNFRPRPHTTANLFEGECEYDTRVRRLQECYALPLKSCDLLFCSFCCSAMARTLAFASMSSHFSSARRFASATVTMRSAMYQHTQVRHKTLKSRQEMKRELQRENARRGERTKSSDIHK
jgi:hypothetical protein